MFWTNILSPSYRNTLYRYLFTEKWILFQNYLELISFKLITLICLILSNCNTLVLINTFEAKVSSFFESGLDLTLFFSSDKVSVELQQPLRVTDLQVKLLTLFFLTFLLFIFCQIWIICDFTKTWRSFVLILIYVLPLIK